MAADGDGDGGGGGGKPSSRWLDAVRYTVAAVVTVLIVAVIVNAIRVVLRPDSLTLSVVGGSVFTRRFPALPYTDVVTFYFTLQAVNPSGRAMMYYVNIKAYIFDKNVSTPAPNPQVDSFLYFQPVGKDVPQLTVKDFFTTVNGTKTSMTPSSFDTLYNNNNGAIIRDAWMQLDGNLVTEVSSGHNRTTRGATYYCRPLIVGGDPDDEVDKGRQNAPCRMVQGSN